MPVAGVLGPARPVSLAGGVLSLEYAADYEGLRQRGLKMTGEIDAAMTALSGKKLTCKLSPADGSDSQEPARRAFGGLSAAETAEVSKDPAVKTMIDEFGGTLLDVRRDMDAGLPTVAPDDEGA